ncbi:Receptor-like protein [Vigna angularis]|uniref:non-specific serine/threonine protein kinase n=1 Tax=Phaseolus angularis TaxID=3914 RepID=A0A8T0KKS3_PHAAN|nr:Receptor-like protein [Vigna angularis]
MVVAYLLPLHLFSSHTQIGNCCTLYVAATATPYRSTGRQCRHGDPTHFFVYQKSVSSHSPTHAVAKNQFPHAMELHPTLHNHPKHQFPQILTCSHAQIDSETHLSHFPNMSAAFRLLLLLSLFSLLTAQQHDQRQILLNLKSSLKSSNFSKLFDSWNDTNSVCSFNGVICNTLRSVTEINLSNQNLTGVLPFDSLCNLPSLQKLAFGYNGLYGNVSEDIRKCVTLRYLDLGNNLFSGPFPDISPLNQLEYLFLNKSGFSGTFPWQSLLNMTGLLQLSVGDNPFDFTPFPKEVVSLKKLNWLYLLEGDLSELKYLTNLVSLQFFENNLSGEIPDEIGEFKGLKSLSLYRNKLTGPIPQKVGSWAEFDFIDVSENFLSGTIPPEMCKKGKMTALLVLQNNLSGEIPATYGDCWSMKRFRVSNNSLSGTVPPAIWGLPNAEIIDIELNQFEGSVASDIRNAKTLGSILARQNRLSGEIPDEISKATSLVTLDLSENQISGKIPEGIGELKELGSLHLQNNRLSGSIPESLGSCKSLNDIDLSRNLLSGEIPTSLGSFPALNSLNLSDNDLSGEIPGGLAFLRLSLFDLSYNRLTGKIPQALTLEAYNGSLSGNPGLCSIDAINSFPRCSSSSGISKDMRDLVICFAIASILLLSCLGVYLQLKRRKEEGERFGERSLKEESWDVKSFHVLSFSEGEILDSIKQENLIGKGGSGNVYRVTLSNGKELAVKHIWNTDVPARKKSWSSTPMLGNKQGGRSKEFDAEVQALSSIRHVNVVKLYCSITSEDSSLLVYEYLPNGSLWDRLHTSRKMELDWETRIWLYIQTEFGENKDLVSWVHNMARSKEGLRSAVDSRIPEMYKEEACKVLRTAVLCTGTLPALRPTMRAVVQKLEDAEPCKLVGIVISKDGGEKKIGVNEKK